MYILVKDRIKILYFVDKQRQTFYICLQNSNKINQNLTQVRKEGQNSTWAEKQE